MRVTTDGPDPGRRLRVELFVDDVDVSVQWYRSLGFVPAGDDRGTYRPMTLGAVAISLQARAVLPGDHPLAGGGPGVPSGIGVELVIELDDREALERAHARALGARCAPTDTAEQPWGLRDFRVQDPDGYYLRFTHVA